MIVVRKIMESLAESSWRRAVRTALVPMGSRRTDKPGVLMTLAEFEPSYISVNVAGDVVTARFLLTHLTDEENVEQMGLELFTLVDQFGCRKLILDLEGVRYVTSSVLGKLITLHRRMHRQGGKLVICGLEPPVREIITMSHLHDYLHLADSLLAARNAFTLEA